MIPDTYEAWTIVALPFVVLTALGQLVFAYNLVQTLRGKRRPHDDRPLLLDERQVSLAGATAVLVLLALASLGRSLPIPQSAGEGSPMSAGAPVKEAPGGAAAEAGRQLFADNCGSCHVLSAAGTTGTIGPNLDALQPDKRRVLDAIEKGGTGTGAMPAGLLSDKDAETVAELVAGGR